MNIDNKFRIGSICSYISYIGMIVNIQYDDDYKKTFIKIKIPSLNQLYLYDHIDFLKYWDILSY